MIQTRTSPVLSFQPLWTPEVARIVSDFPKKGIFLTGIEGSDPKIDGVRRNQLKEAHDFYQNYEARLEKIRELGITWLRFGMPYSQVHAARDHFDFSFCDKVVKKCGELGITIMADLLHFGLPDWLHEELNEDQYFQNRFFPGEFARYAHAFAERYPHIRHYTIVNEPYLTAFFSSKLGLWNEHRWGDGWQDDRPFVNATRNIAQAAILGRKAIEGVWDHEGRKEELIFVQNESFEVSTAAPGSGREAEAERFNLRRFAVLDLIFGVRDETMRRYLLDQGLSDAEYEWFMDYGSMTKTVLGIDHYPTCVHTFYKDRTQDNSPTDPYRLYEITKEYWERYPLPLLHTEVNAWPDHALSLCQQTYDAMARLKQEGYPVIGMGWYGDDLQVGWHVAMRGPRSKEENPVGLFYKGDAQPVALLFGQLLQTGFPDRGETVDVGTWAAHSF
ncbi:MAG TPA: family 1 glycosylhydrolase [Patescibacteria group bacterium]